MSRQPLGKTLLRNVIRHTDAHNKIQEETDMWKMREWELQTPQRKHLSATASMRAHMHCDRESDPSTHISRSRVSEHDDREARYWTKQLYDFEDKDPDRWGHSGFKELYPEDFTSDSDSSDSQKMTKVKKSNKSGKEAKLSKRSKKSSRKKKKKKKKKELESKRTKAECRSSGSDDGVADKDRRRKRSKSRHKNKKSVKRYRDSDSSSVDSDKDKERHSCRRKKSKQGSHKPSDSGPDSKKTKRKDWQAAGEESSDGSSGD
ncbi:uncharacterized protein NKAPD1 [Eucyclogobius newberryi]|uniref:uncharacterized protein NKAPD1 n=1 Tax=Eucyclogobius newberryi TaxID=166745 RepID=UPI003B5936D0